MVILIFFSGTSFYSEHITGNEAWRKLESAHIAFEDNELGAALLYCEQAKVQHTKTISGYISDLRTSLSPSEVKQAGDDLQSVYAVLVKRNDLAALEILDAVFLNHPVEYFGKSIQALLLWLEKRLVYPEADFLTGKIYEAEGENFLALANYRKAWENKEFLEIPDERYSLAYRMADLSFIMGQKGEQEKYLLLVLLNDPLYGKPGDESPTLEAMLRTVEIDPTLEKFFSLYRHSNYIALKAYQNLAELYQEANNNGRAVALATLAASISVTHLAEAVKQADFSYVYSGLNDLFIRSRRNNEISVWASERKLFDSFLIFASILNERGSREQAISLWTSLSLYCSDKTVSLEASRLLELSRL